MCAEYRSEDREPPKDKDDEIVALSNALKDQVRNLKARMRPEGIKGEAPSFSPDQDDGEP